MLKVRARGMAAALLLLVTACVAGPSVEPPVAPEPAAPEAAAAPEPAPSPSPAPAPAPTEAVTEFFDRTNFTNPTRIDNPWLPLTPGSHWVWDGEATVDGERIERRVVLTVTDLTKVIDGIRTRVVHEIDYNSGELIEAELIFFAQDDDGNVWHLGQYPEEYDQGRFVDAPGWIHGLQGAHAGIMMQRQPRPGAPTYSQGWGPEVGWTDRAFVSEVGGGTCVPAGCYGDVITIDESAREEPNAHQLKYYAPGVGNVRVGWWGAGETEQEVLELTQRQQLTGGALAAVRAEVLRLEDHAYQLDHDVYKYTLPIEQGALPVTPAARNLPGRYIICDRNHHIILMDDGTSYYRAENPGEEAAIAAAYGPPEETRVPMPFFFDLVRVSDQRPVSDFLAEVTA